MDYLQSSEVDVAYDILIKANEPLYYKDLIMDVIEKKQKPIQSLAMAISEIYTHINMDSRFHYEGKGKWGLTKWCPPETKRHSARAATKSASAASRRKEKLFESIQE